MKTTILLHDVYCDVTYPEYLHVRNRYYKFGCNSTFEHPAYLNSGNNDVEAYIYWILGEIIVVHHQKFQELNINKSYFCKFDGIRRNFNWRSICKNLCYVLNYIIYWVKAWINKIKNDMNSFYGTKKRWGGLNANIS